MKSRRHETKTRQFFFVLFKEIEMTQDRKRRNKTKTTTKKEVNKRSKKRMQTSETIESTSTRAYCTGKNKNGT